MSWKFFEKLSNFFNGKENKKSQILEKYGYQISSDIEKTFVTDLTNLLSNNKYNIDIKNKKIAVFRTQDETFLPVAIAYKLGMKEFNTKTTDNFGKFMRKTNISLSESANLVDFGDQMADVSDFDVVLCSFNCSQIPNNALIVAANIDGIKLFEYLKSMKNKIMLASSNKSIFALKYVDENFFLKNIIKNTGVINSNSKNTDEKKESGPMDMLKILQTGNVTFNEIKSMILSVKEMLKNPMFSKLIPNGDTGFFTKEVGNFLYIIDTLTPKERAKVELLSQPSVQKRIMKGGNITKQQIDALIALIGHLKSSSKEYGDPAKLMSKFNGMFGGGNNMFGNNMFGK